MGDFSYYYDKFNLIMDLVDEGRQIAGNVKPIVAGLLRAMRANCEGVYYGQLLQDCENRFKAEYGDIE